MEARAGTESCRVMAHATLAISGCGETDIRDAAEKTDATSASAPAIDRTGEKGTNGSPSGDARCTRQSFRKPNQVVSP